MGGHRPRRGGDGGMLGAGCWVRPAGGGAPLAVMPLCGTVVEHLDASVVQTRDRARRAAAGGPPPLWRRHLTAVQAGTRWHACDLRDLTQTSCKPHRIHAT